MGRRREGPLKQRYRLDCEVSPVSTTRQPSPPDPEPLHFAFGGRITAWDPINRRLKIGTRTLWVAPGVPVARLATGAQVTITGYVERPGDSDARWIVTHLTHG